MLLLNCFTTQARVGYSQFTKSLHINSQQASQLIVTQLLPRQEQVCLARVLELAGFHLDSEDPCLLTFLLQKQYLFLFKPIRQPHNIIFLCGLLELQDSSIKDLSVFDLSYSYQQTITSPSTLIGEDTQVHVCL